MLTQEEFSTKLKPDISISKKENQLPERKLRDWRPKYQTSRPNTMKPRMLERSKLHSSRTPLMLMLSHTTQQRAHQLPQRKPMTPQLQEQVTVQLQDPEMEPEVQVQEQVLLTEPYESAHEG
jgi:hypothetical protein